MNNLFRQFMFILYLLAVGPQLVFAQPLERAKEGTLACIGNHHLRLGGSEITFTGYTLRNFNAETSITIESITLFDADGVVLSAMTPGSFPSGFKDMLGPNQTTSFTTRDIFGDSNIRPSAQIPLQTLVKWTATSRGVALFGNSARQDRGLDSVGGAIREQRARGIMRCVALK